MSKIINAVPGILTFKNIYVEEDSSELVYNTGSSALGFPLSDENPDDSGKALVVDVEAWKAKHIAAIQIFRTNNYTYLVPGDEFNLKVESAEAAAYYLSLVGQFDFVTVEPYEGAEDPTIGVEEVGDNFIITYKHLDDGSEGDPYEQTVPCDFEEVTIWNAETWTAPAGKSLMGWSIDGESVALSEGGYQRESFIELTNWDGHSSIELIAFWED